MKKIAVSILAFAAFIVAFSTAAFAGTEALPPDGSGWIEALKPVLDAVMHSQWWVAAALAVVAALLAMKKLAPDDSKIQKVLHTDIGGTSFAFLVAFFGACGTAFLASGTNGFSFALVGMSAKISFFAIGGYTVLKKLVLPLVQRLAAWEKTPAWLKTILAVIVWALSRPDAVAQAEEAGNAAVKDAPAAGTAAIAGKPNEIA